MKTLPNPEGSARILLFDIEATQLKGDFGRLLSFGWKWFQKGKAQVKDITEFPKRFRRDPTDDRELAVFARRILEQADLWVTWYGKRFDIPFLNTRLLAHREPMIRPTSHDDGWEIARFNLKLHSNRLASVSAFLGLEEKTPLKPEVWTRATAGHPPSIHYVDQHCRQDVYVLEAAYEILRSYSKTPTNINLTRDSEELVGKLGACPVCGSSRLQSRGHRLARTSKRRSFYCTNCGAWSAGPPIPTLRGGVR